MTLHFTNARLINPENGTDSLGSLTVEEGVIVALDGPAPKGAHIRDCGGACLAPGIVDFGVKIGEPGERHKESFRSAGKAARKAAAALNYSFFNAPHVALLFMPSFGDSVRVASDIGMYAQTFLLSLTARGLGGVPQTSLGFFAQTMREFLGVPDELRFLFGISFGYPDATAPCNRMRTGRDPLSHSVTFHC